MTDTDEVTTQIVSRLLAALYCVNIIGDDLDMRHYCNMIEVLLSGTEQRPGWRPRESWKPRAMSSPSIRVVENREISE
jgi:hypothetical protein